MNLEEKLKEIMQDKQSLDVAFASIQMPRSSFALKHFVIQQQDTIEKQYEQCVLELQNAYDAVRIGMLRRELKINEINNMGLEGTEGIKRNIAKIELEQLERALLGAIRELSYLYDLWKQFKKHYTYEEIQDAQKEYWEKRLVRQASQDILALGRISQGNLDALRQAGLYPELNQNLLDELYAHVIEEKRSLEDDNKVRKIQTKTN